MNIHYSLDSAVVLDPVQGPAVLSQLKAAGVTDIWLWGYFFGKMWSPVESMAQAAETLRKHGFASGVIQLPVGHPGNALNPDDDSLELHIPEDWLYRIDSTGQSVHFCADINQSMIRDNLQSIEQLQAAGFHRFFMDDDLRMGNWGLRTEGCFCTECLAGFNVLHRFNVTRESLAVGLAQGDDRPLIQAWTAFNCAKVTAFMEAMQLPDTELGIMVMHLGDERHGIDISAIRSRIPNCMVRVGESHFSDNEFHPPEGKAAELFGILHHLQMTGRDNVYSETTVFPAHALSPDHFIYKAKLALAAGISNLFLMSGTWLITENYWRAFAERLPELRFLDRECTVYDRHFPIHLAYGTKGFPESVAAILTPIMAGMPVIPLRGGEDKLDGNILLFFGDYELTAEWEKQIPDYELVIMDRKAAERNKACIERVSSASLLLWDYETGSGPVEEEIANLQMLLVQEMAKRKLELFPLLVKGQHFALFWLKERQSVLVINLKDESNKGLIIFQGIEYGINIEPLGIKLLEWDLLAGSLNE